MNDDLLAIIEDLTRLDVVIEHLATVPETPSGMAYQLQMLYTGFEKAAEKCLKSVNVKIPSTEAYHQKLLDEFFKHFEFRENEAKMIRNLLAFRHFSRWAYGQKLIPDRVQELRAGALEVWPSVKSTLMRHMGIGDTDLLPFS